jgi:hypothetical protein
LEEDSAAGNGIVEQGEIGHGLAGKKGGL